MSGTQTFEDPRCLRLGLLALVGLFVACRIWVGVSTSFVGRTPDSPGYLSAVGASWTDPSLWWGARPPVVPAIYKLLDGKPEKIATVQLFLSIAAWSLVAVAASGNLGAPWLRLVACAGILTISSTREIVLWDRLLLGESVSLSVLGIHIATWFCWTKKPSIASTFAVCTTGWIWGWAKDSNAFVLLVLGVASLLFGSVSQARRWHLAWIASMFIVCFLLVSRSSDLGIRVREPLSNPHPRDMTFEVDREPRWAFSLTNVVAERILPIAEYRNWFALHGMPDDLETLNFGKEWLSNDEFRGSPYARVGSFQRWTRTAGKAVYQRFLLTHPTWTLEVPLESGKDLFASSTAFYGKEIEENGFEPLMPKAVEGLVFTRTLAYTAGVATLVLFGVAITLFFKTRRTEWWIPFGLILISFPHAVVVWHGDSMEVARHALQMNAHLRIGSWILVLQVAEHLLGWKGPITSHRTEPSSPRLCVRSRTDPS